MPDWEERLPGGCLQLRAAICEKAVVKPTAVHTHLNIRSGRRYIQRERDHPVDLIPDDLWLLDRAYIEVVVVDREYDASGLLERHLQLHERIIRLSFPPGPPDSAAPRGASAPPPKPGS
jgi:hypothetical protein